MDSFLRGLENIHKRLDKTDELIQKATTQHKDPRGYHLAEREYVTEAKRIIRRISSCIRELDEESRDLIRDISIADETSLSYL